MRKRTTLNIDAELLSEAERAIGTTGATETIHRALREIVNARRRQWLLDYDFPGLTPESLEEMRRDREFAKSDEPRSA
ncbi:MAG TPA: type II toxin-antitoxin system VapB family antitoxin [Chloroflexota bacterium]|nr:type II toxin-antitoxin system VapB family antitoxin [Chloroflexota bacterium]